MTTELTIPSDLTGLRRAQEQTEDALRASSSLAEQDTFSIKLAIEEALVDAIKHGNQMDPNKRIHITVERVEVRITVEGSGVTRTVSLPPPT